MRRCEQLIINMNTKRTCLLFVWCWILQAKRPMTAEDRKKTLAKRRCSTVRRCSIPLTIRREELGRGTVLGRRIFLSLSARGPHVAWRRDQEAERPGRSRAPRTRRVYTEGAIEAGERAAREVLHAMDCIGESESRNWRDVARLAWVADGAHRRRRWGQGALKFGKIFFGQLLCKFGHFSGKNHVKFGNFVHFSGKYHKNPGILIIFRARIM